MRPQCRLSASCYLEGAPARQPPEPAPFETALGQSRPERTSKVRLFLCPVETLSSKDAALSLDLIDRNAEIAQEGVTAAGQHEVPSCGADVTCLAEGMSQRYAQSAGEVVVAGASDLQCVLMPLPMRTLRARELLESLQRICHIWPSKLVVSVASSLRAAHQARIK